jgi:hypothetical protein
MGQERIAKLERRLRREYEDKLKAERSQSSFASRLTNWSVIGWVSAALLSCGTAALTLAGQYSVSRLLFFLGLCFLCLKTIISESRQFAKFRHLFVIFTWVVFIGVAVLLEMWVQRTQSDSAHVAHTEDPEKKLRPDVRSVFIHDWTNSLQGVFVVIKLTKETDLDQLGDYAFVVQLSNATSKPPVASILVGGHNKVGTGMFGITKGHQSLLWTYEPYTQVNGTFVWQFGTLNRLEAGASFDGKSPVPTLGELDHALIQIHCSPTLAPLIEKISVFANDYEIYTVTKSRLRWKPMVRDINLYRALPHEMKAYNYVDAELQQFTLDFADVDVRRVPILYSGKVWTPSGETIFPGSKGWLPDAVLDE